MVSANMLYATETDARNAPAGELTILLCQYCGFVFNATFNPDLVPYGKQYENDQSKSGRFLAHMQDMAARIRATLRERALRAVEVGCGQGQFLRLLMGIRPTAHDRAAGFDPSYVGDGIPGCTVHRTYFGPESVSLLEYQPNTIVARHVIEHIPDPSGFLRAVHAAVDLAPNATVFFETPSIQWIFENDAFWDLCYEHCSCFTAASLAFAFESCGFRPRQVEAVFGEQYLWIEADIGQTRRAMPESGEALALRFARTIAAKQKRWRENLMTLRPAGKVAVWGAATKGAMFVQDVDPESTLVQCLIDINPMKQNRYLPLTAHPVLSWQSAIAEGVSTIVVTNPNYLDEINTLLGVHSVNVNVLSL